MNWRVWDKIERFLLEENIKPLLGVIPDNEDESLFFEDRNEEFWNRVRSWQKNGWEICLHGYKHRYVTEDSGILRINKFSEFAGLGYVIQREKIENGLRLFRLNGISTSCWIAPGHSFDDTTLDILATKDIKIISDGLHVLPYMDSNGLIWIPQQLWRIRKFPFGVWTVCYHHNNWKENELNVFMKDVVNIRSSIVDKEFIIEKYSKSRRGVLNALSSKLLFSLLRLKRLVKSQV